MDQQPKTKPRCGQSPIMEVESIATLYESARLAKTQAQITKDVLAAAMLDWIREQLPVGTLIDLRHKPENPLPIHLRNIKVMSGNDRKTKIFRIERIRFVEPDATHPDLSTWSADATPISMTTGKDMSGLAGNSRHAREFLGLKGSFGFETYCDD